MTDQTKPATGHSLPIFGPLFRLLASGGVGRIYVLTALAVVLWGISFAVFGVPGLFVPAVIATPTVLFILVLISRG